MIDPWLIPSGIGMGLAVSAPLGPVNIVCISRTLRFGFATGLLSGLGAVLGDGFFAAIAALGLTAVSDTVEAQANLIQLIGGAALVLFGLVVMIVPPARVDAAGEVTPPTPRRAVLTAFALTVSNPGPLLGFAAFFGGVGDLVRVDSWVAAGILLASVVLGCALWWVSLTGGIALVRHRLSPWTMRLINVFSGGALLVLGVVVLAHSAWPW